MDNKIKIGVIGVGMAWDKLHYPALTKLSDKYEIGAVCNKSPDKAENFAKSINLSPENVYTDYKELLERGDIDAVFSMVPISENYEVAKDVLEAGKNLLAEKPIAADTQAAQELIDLEGEKQVKFMVAENFRYEEENTIIKNIIDSGKIGEVMYFVLSKSSDFKEEMKGDTFAAKDWRQHPQYEGGMLLDGGVHDIALLRFLFGDAESIYACGRPQEEDFSPYMALSCLIKFKNGVFGQLTYNPQGTDINIPPGGFGIFGTLGNIFLESRDSGVVNINYKGGGLEQITYTPSNGYYHELLNFYNAVQNKEEIVSTPEKAKGDLDLLNALLTSAKTETMVYLN